MVGIRQDDHAVTVEVRTTGGVRELGARYLVGCDGAGSNAAGSRASTLPAPTRPSPVGWQWSTWWTRRSRGEDFTTRRTACTCTGSGVSRMSTVEFNGPPRQVEPLTVEELQDSIRRVSGTAVTITTMSSGTRWIDTPRQATTYRTGRVLLAGDAAHVYAPVGGQASTSVSSTRQPRLEARGRGVRLGRRGHPRHVHHRTASVRGAPAAEHPGPDRPDAPRPADEGAVGDVLRPDGPRRRPPVRRRHACRHGRPVRPGRRPPVRRHPVPGHEGDAGAVRPGRRHRGDPVGGPAA